MCCGDPRLVQAGTWEGRRRDSGTRRVGKERPLEGPRNENRESETPAGDQGRAVREGEPWGVRMEIWGCGPGDQVLGCGIPGSVELGG